MTDNRASSPQLHDLWNGQAEFRSENPIYKAMSVNLMGTTEHSGAGKLSLDVLKDGRLVGVYRRENSQPFTIHMSFSNDGLNFYDDQIVAQMNGWRKHVGDPSVLVFDIQNEEHIFIFYEAEARQFFENVAVNTAMMWSANYGRTWKQQEVPLTESSQIPNWNRSRFRGTSVPTAVIGSDNRHIWVYWSGLYESDPNHSEVGAGYIGVVHPGTHIPLSLDNGGLLEQRDDGWFLFTIDAPQRNSPVIERGPYDWCKGAVDIGNVIRGDDSYYYSVFIGGCVSEGNDDDTFSIGIARTTGMVSFEKYPNPILVPTGLGRHHGLQFPHLCKIGGGWYLYYVVANGDFGGDVPNVQERHARLKLQWK